MRNEIGNSLPALAKAETGLTPREEMDAFAAGARMSSQDALAKVLELGESSDDTLRELEAADAAIMHAIRILRARRPQIMAAAE